MLGDLHALANQIFLEGQAGLILDQLADIIRAERKDVSQQIQAHFTIGSILINILNNFFRGGGGFISQHQLIFLQGFDKFRSKQAEIRYQHAFHGTHHGFPAGSGGADQAA